MAGSVKYFQFVQKFHQIIGVYPSQSNQKHCSINWIQVIFLINSALFLFTTAAFILIEAKSMFDYGFTFYAFSCMINVIVIYLTFIRQSENTLKYIENCEQFIEKSKYVLRFWLWVAKPRVRLFLSFIYTLREPRGFFFKKKGESANRFSGQKLERIQVISNKRLGILWVGETHFVNTNPNICVLSKEDSRPLTNIWLAKLSGLISACALLYAFRLPWSISRTYHTLLPDTTYSIWERTHSVCFYRLGLYGNLNLFHFNFNYPIFDWLNHFIIIKL